MKKPPLVSEDDWEGIEDDDIVDDQSRSLWLFVSCTFTAIVTNILLYPFSLKVTSIVYLEEYIAPVC